LLRSLSVANLKRVIESFDVENIVTLKSGLGGHWGSLEMVPFESLTTVSYSHGPIFIIFEIKVYIGRKSRFFHIHLHSTLPLEWSPSQYCHKVWCAKLKWCGYVYSFWHNTRTWQTDGRTDGRTVDDGYAATAVWLGCSRAVKYKQVFEVFEVEHNNQRSLYRWQLYRQPQVQLTTGWTDSDFTKQWKNTSQQSIINCRPIPSFRTDQAPRSHTVIYKVIRKPNNAFGMPTFSDAAKRAGYYVKA